jgi:hypothetical protein
MDLRAIPVQQTQHAAPEKIRVSAAGFRPIKKPPVSGAVQDGPSLRPGPLSGSIHWVT